MTLLEIAMLVEKKRISLAVPIKRYLQNLQNQYPVLPINAEIASEAFGLSMPQGDPFDRVIVATARHHGLPLISRDQSITASKLVTVLW
jgi:PIN domain nuclease of toxin-antitoxin system